jgi:uncharacterized membrane protein
MKTLVAVICAVIAALGYNYSAYLWKKAVDRLPRVKFKLQAEVLRAFFTNRPWLFATGIMLGASVFYGIALAFAAASIVAPIIASGLAFLAYLAIKNLGERPRTVDLVAIGLDVLGVAFIGASLAEDVAGKVSSNTLSYNATALWVVAGVTVLLAVVIPLTMRLAGAGREAAGLGISIGLLYGWTTVFARILLYDWTKGMFLGSLVFVIAWAAVTIPGLVIYQAALQRGMAVIVVPIQAGLAQLIPIIVGMTILGEAFPRSGVLTALRIAGFACVLVATIILAQRSEEPVGETSAVVDETGLAAEEL